MINHFNYTDRKRVRHHMVRLTVDAGPPRRFDAAFDFSAIEVPADARIYVYALAGGSSTVMRFPFGTVAEPAPPPAGTALTELAGSAVHFTVKIVDERDDVGRLVGLCENMRPSAPGEPDETAGRLSILPVNACDLGERVWRLNFAKGRPWLEVNNQIAGVNMEWVARNDDAFFALVYPEVVRRILRRVTVHHGRFEVTNDDDWQAQWLRFAAHWHPDKSGPPPVGNADAPSEAEVDATEEWIDAVVDRFCWNNGVRTKYEAAANGENQT